MWLDLLYCYESVEICAGEEEPDSKGDGDGGPCAGSSGLLGV